MPEIELDPELLSDFIVESRELLEEFSSNILELEDRPNDPGIVSAAFRAAHTLKGSSAFFNLVHIKNFSHKMENLLDDLRNKRRAVTPAGVDILLSGATHLKNMFARLSSKDFSTEMEDAEQRFLNELLSFLETKEEAVALTAEESVRVIKELIGEFKKNSGNPGEILLKIDALLSGLGLEPGSAASGRPAATPDPGPGEGTGYGFLGVDLTAPFSRAVEIMDQAVVKGEIDGQDYDHALAALLELARANKLAELEKQFAEALDDFRAINDSGIGFDALLLNMMKDKLEGIKSLVVVKTGSPPPPTTEGQARERRAEPPNGEPARQTREEKSERKTMRIDEEKVDGFMNYVGELIVTAETFNYLQKMIESEKVNPQTVRAFKNANQAFRELSDELQESLMEIRRVPIKGLLQKVNMMARELSHQMGKKVRVELEGQDVQLDKSIAESLEGPLVHVVRNSLDHGLEPPEERSRSGKPGEGLLAVSASSDKEFFYLSVSDDGKGIDPDRMRLAAVEKRMMSEVQAAALTDKEAIGLIFGAGFSTAREITDVSDRGVGMDVVRTNIQQLNGTVQVDSKVGRGATISMKIPLSVTLQVIKALLVRVGTHNFIISLDNIVESLRPAGEELSTIEGRGEVICRRGLIFPLIRMYDIFNIKPEITDPTKSILVVVETTKGRYGLMVDEVLGQQQVVVKELDWQFKNLAFIAGSATLGDGRLGLVLDAEGVVGLALGL
ncbi:MAG: chemotaxis protein CheA [Pseudomonadota bacterium]